MRKYSIGAFLLDRDDPGKVIGRLREPLLMPNHNEREGYVPNVVYTCGALLHNGELIVPYGLADYATTWHGLAAFGNIMGSMDEALAALRQAERLEPLSAAIACDFGFLLYWARRYAEAIDACRRALDLHPSFARTYVALARAHAAQGHCDEAAGICLEARPLFRGRAFLRQLLATLGYCYGRSGRTAEAEAVLGELRRMGREHYVSPYDIATIHAGMGNQEQAMESLQTAVEEHAFWLIALPIEPLFDPMRGDRQFERLCDGIWAKRRSDRAAPSRR